MLTRRTFNTSLAATAAVFTAKSYARIAGSNERAWLFRILRNLYVDRWRHAQRSPVKESFDDDESETLLRGFLSGELYRRGLICRADDRGDPVIQLSPPLIAGPEQFAEIEAILRGVLTEAGERMQVHAGGREHSALEETRRP